MTLDETPTDSLKLHGACRWYNEQTKLLAGALDRASTARFTVGVAAPAAAAIYTTSTRFDALTFMAAAAGWLIAALA